MKLCEGKGGQVVAIAGYPGRLRGREDAKPGRSYSAKEMTILIVSLAKPP